MEIGFWPLIGIIFFILKITKLINWNWKWVLAPFWIPIVCAFLFWLVVISIAAIAGMMII